MLFMQARNTQIWKADNLTNYRLHAKPEL